MSGRQEQSQVDRSAAEVYESTFVPAIFGAWAPLLVDAAGVAPGQAVLDVACGTGVVARTAAERLAGNGRVVGSDLNPAMLEVARRLRPDIDWRQADAAHLPFADGSFDVVLCQSALMFFPDLEQSLREMRRVATTDGTIGAQVWGSLESQPGYGPFVEVAARHAGRNAAQLLSSYWVLGDLDALTGRFGTAGLRVTATHTRLGVARFASIDEMVSTEVQNSPLGERIDEPTLRGIVEDSRVALARFTRASGRVDLPILGHLIIARRQ